MRKSSSCSAPLTTRPRRLWFRIATSLNSLPPSYSSPRLLTDQHFISLLTRKRPPSMILGSWRQRQRIQRRRLFRKWHWRSVSPWGLTNFQAVFGNLTARTPVPGVWTFRRRPSHIVVRASRPRFGRSKRLPFKFFARLSHSLQDPLGTSSPGQ